MQRVKVVPVFALLLMALCGCEKSLVEREQIPLARQARTARADGVISTPPSNGIGGFEQNPGGQPLPYPTITRQTFIPPYGPFAHFKTLTWRIEWPHYPAGTDPDKIPTVFTLSNGALNSFDLLNGQPASSTYKTNFNLYHNAQLETSRTLWDELIHAFDAGDEMEITWFNKIDVSVKTLEHWVKERPSQFGHNWEDNNQDPPVYQQGDVFLFKLLDQNRHGGIRIVSMTPRIIEVYLAVPNN